MLSHPTLLNLKTLKISNSTNVHIEKKKIMSLAFLCASVIIPVKCKFLNAQHLQTAFLRNQGLYFDTWANLFIQKFALSISSSDWKTGM